MSFVLDPIGDLLSGAADLVGSALKTVEKTVQNVLNNPLQVIETVALTAALGPGGLALAATETGAYAIANAAVSAMNGGSIEKIALAAASSYAGGQIGNYAGSLAGEMGLTDASLKQIVVSSSASASAAALSGKPLDQILAAGASGAVGTLVRQNLIEQGFDPKGFDTRAITNASTAAANAILSGKDVNLAIGNALAATTLSTAVNGASASVKAAYQNLTDNTTKLGELNNKYYDAQVTANSYFINNVEPLQQDAQQKYDTAMAAQNAYNAKYAEYQNELNTYNAAAARQDADTANASAEKINAMVPDIEALATAYNSAANEYLNVVPKLEDVQNVYKGYTDNVKDLGTQLDATNRVVEQGVKDTATALYNTTSLTAPAATVETATKSTLDTVMDANTKAWQNAVNSGNSLLMQAVLDGNTGVITAMANNDIAGAELAYKGALEATKPDLSQGDVNVTTTPTTPVNYEPNTTWNPVVVTPTPRPEGETSGTGTTGTETGSTQYPVVDNGDGTSSQVNPDGSVTTFDNATGSELTTEAPNTTTPDDQEATQEIVNTINGPTSPFEVKPAETTTTPTEPVAPTEPTTTPTEPVAPTEPTTTPTEPVAPTEPTTTTTEPVAPTEPTTTPTDPVAPTEPTTTGTTTTPTEPVTPYPLGQVTNPDGSITTTYSDGTTTTTPGASTGTTSGTDVLAGGTGTGTTSGTGTGTSTGTGTGTNTGGTGTTGTTSGTGTTTTTGGGSTSTGSGTGTTAATVAGALGLLGTGLTGSSGTQTLGGVALPEAKFVKGTQIASPLASKYDIPTYKPQQSTTDQGDILEQIQEAASGGLIQHFSDGGDVFPAAPGLIRGRRSQFANPLGLSLTALAPTDLRALGHAEGGAIEGHNPQFFSEGGLNSLQNTYVKGEGDGTSDSVPAMLANGEFVIPADVVSSLGNGSNDAGAAVLDKFLVAIRNHKKQTNGKDLPPDSKGPLAYLLAANKKVRA